MLTASRDAILTRSLEASRAPRASLKAYPGLGLDYGVTHVLKHGAYLRLADGSLWEILSTGRAFVRTWMPLSAITIIAADDPVGHYKYGLCYQR